MLTNGTVDWLRGQISFKGLVDRNSVDVGIIHEPNDLVGEQLGIVLRVQVRLRRFGGVELEPFPDTFSQDIKGWVGFHNFSHGLLD